MYSTIINYFRNLKAELIIQAPSRINLINPLDAVEADYWMPSVAINGEENPLSVFLYIKSTSKSMIKIYDLNSEEKQFSISKKSEEIILKDLNNFKKKFHSEFKLVYASLYRFCKTSRLFKERFFHTNLEIGIITTIPRQSGLGGSAAIIIAILYGLAKYFDLINNFRDIRRGELPINRDLIAEMATIVEDKDLSITAGYGDRYVISRGGLSFCSYYGKLNHKDIYEEPLAIYDDIGKTYNIKNIPILVCFSGMIHQSGSVHDKLREFYMEGEPNIRYLYKKLGILAWKSRFCLMAHDWEQLGELFRENTRIMNKVMNIAGFKYGIGLANNILIKLIEDNPDVYAAKLTGAGGGGCVFAMVNPERIDDILLDWKKRVGKIIENEKYYKSKFPNYPSDIRVELKKARFFKIKIDQIGVREIKESLA